MSGAGATPSVGGCAAPPPGPASRRDIPGRANGRRRDGAREAGRRPGKPGLDPVLQVLVVRNEGRSIREESVEDLLRLPDHLEHLRSRCEKPAALRPEVVDPEKELPNSLGGALYAMTACPA